ncbi:uncharacterized protein LOC119353257 [Triticum dicoccoides]|uniref:uncharacterized protein LOC119353257 n=1 Tax=Triticum dicoccoides TaxID=85692 RepID=UPI00188FEF60|nr:uncharacterized protein LOC119353257 [Triticum dicoccoides]
MIQLSFSYLTETYGFKRPDRCTTLVGGLEEGARLFWFKAAGVTIANWAAVEPTKEAMKYAVAYQPVVASIYTNSKFRRYSKGFLEVPRNPGPVNHSVLLLGYGECPLQGECWIGISSYRNRRRWGITWRGQYRNIFFLPRNTCHVEGALRVLTNVVLPLGASMVPKVKTRSESCPACFK